MSEHVFGPPIYPNDGDGKPERWCALCGLPDRPLVPKECQGNSDEKDEQKFLPVEPQPGGDPVQEPFDPQTPEGRKAFLKQEWVSASHWFCQLKDEQVTALVASLEVVLQSGEQKVLLSMPIVHLARLSLIQLIDRFRSGHKAGDRMAPSGN